MSMSRERRALLGAVVVLIAALVVVLGSYVQWHLRSSKDVAASVVDTLRALGEKALETDDVPVGAVLLYGDTIVGTGYNTVQRFRSAGGHAEIGAISDAFRRLGINRFQSLDRDSLVLVTTFEPCLMCRGAILEYNIKHTIFLKGKPALLWAREDLRTLRYSWTRKQGGPSSLQDSLFRKHPLFPR